MRLTTLYSGCGGVEFGAIAAGFRPAVACEFRREIAAIHRANFPGCTVKVQDVATIAPDPSLAIAVHASPSCKPYSAAQRQRRGDAHPEASPDLLLADWLRWARPLAMSLEQVPRFAQTAAFENWRRAALRYDYDFWCGVVDAANFGVPQSRKRLVAIAVRRAAAIARLSPLLPTGRRSWDDATRDLWPLLPTTQPTKYQQAIALPPGQPLLIQRVGTTYKNGQPRPQVRAAGQQSFTIRALGKGSGGHWRQADIWDGDSLRVATPRVLARLQGFPDSFRWQCQDALVAEAIGNAVPPPLARAAFEAIGRALG